MNPQESFWQRKKVLLTGHSGFKGGWLALWLHRLGASLTGISLPPATAPNLFSLAGIDSLGTSHLGDIRDQDAVATIVREAAPEIVFHLAAQPLVRAGYRQPLETYATNIMGTAHLLDALRYSDSVKVVVVITTDKVYLNREWPYPYREDDPLGGHDPYSTSKAACEIVVAGYRDAFLSGRGVAMATARAGNVIGGGDWSEDRLIPDAVRAWEAGKPLEVRHPGAIRPWQHVLDPLSGYLLLAERLWHDRNLSGAFNFGPETGLAATVRNVVEQAAASYGRGETVWGTEDSGPHEAGLLALEIAKARSLLQIVPRWPLAEAIARTMSWYRRLAEGADALSLCLADIDSFEETP